MKGQVGPLQVRARALDRAVQGRQAGVYFSDDGGAAALRTEIFTVTGG